jgi:hypothetical protein
MKTIDDLKNDVKPAPRLSDLLNAEGDIVYRKLYTPTVVIIHKEEIARLLDGRELNDTTVWEVIQAHQDGK